MRSCYTILLMLLLSVTAMAQTTIFDFEGAAPTFNDFNGSVTTVIDNPDANAPNTTAKVAQNVVPASTEFSGVNITQAVSFTDGKMFTLHVWSPATNIPVLLKLEGDTNVEIAADFTAAANSWQELSFDFSSEPNLNFSSVTVFMNFNMQGSEEMTFYWDNLVQSGAEPVDPFPMTAAPTPTADAAEVVSLFSDAYDDVMVDTFITEWSSAVLVDTMIEGNATLKYEDLDFVGIETTSNTVDLAAAGVTAMHIDYWSANGTFFAVKLVDFGADGAFGGGDDVEHQLDVTGLTQGAWNSIDLQLSDFTGLTTRSNLAQYILVGQPTGTNDVYIDNIYFYVGAPVLSQMDLPVNFDDANVDFGLAGFGGSNGSIVADPEDAGNMVAQVIKDAGAMTWAGVTMTSTSGGPDGFASEIPFAADATVITARVWSPAAGTNVLLKAEQTDDAGVSVETNAMTTTAGAWETLTFDFTNHADGTAALNLDAVYGKLSIFIGFGDSPAAETTYYFDDVIFTGEGGGVTGPMTAAPTPTRDAAEVISLYSDAYTDITVDTYLAEFSNGILTDTMIEGNATLLYSNLNFIGIETIGDNAVDLTAAGMTHLHLDFWSANSTAFRTKLVDFGGDGFGGDNDTEFEIERNLARGQWVTVEYPLSAFAGMNQSDINQMILSSAPADLSNVWIDNIYFYKGEPIGSQMDLPVTFDEEGVDYGLSGFGNSNGAVVEDPTDATNTVGQVIKSAGAETWAGVTMTSTSGGPDGFASRIPFVADATTITVRTWSPAAGVNLLLKAEKTDDPTVSVETTAMTTVAGGWETLTFDFANEATGTAALDLNAVYAKLSIFFDFGNTPAADATYYFDDVIFNGDGGGGGDEPMTAAPTPTRLAENVISMFSNAYTDVAVDTWRTDWSMASLEDIMIEGNDTKKYTGLNFNGVETIGANAIDLTAAEMTHLHVDYWTPNMDTLQIKLVDFGMDGFGGGNDTENEQKFVTTKGQWVGLDIPLTDFAGMAQTDINQFIISARPAGTGTLYLDNVYYYKDITDGTNTPVVGLLEAFPNPVGTTVSITSPDRMQSLTLFSITGQVVGKWTPYTEQFDVEMGHLAPGNYVALVRTEQGLMTIKLLKQ
jgi:hypothetical protein